MDDNHDRGTPTPSGEGVPHVEPTPTVPPPGARPVPGGPPPTAPPPAPPIAPTPTVAPPVVAPRWRPRRLSRQPLPTSPPPGGDVPRPSTRTLPPWLSLPVVICGPIVLIGLVLALLFAPVPTLLPVPTFLVVVVAFVWFDRLEPEPWHDRIHAMLWGATVAIVVALAVNTVVGLAAGELVSIVVSAPIVEEAAKAAGLLWIATRRRLDSVTDGIVYAGWIAAGFAAVENVSYFALAADEGMLFGTFVLRGVLSPFAHPLFTIWIGVTIARAVERGRSPWSGVWSGYLVAVGLHAAWNGAAVFGGGVALLSVVAFIGLFTVTTVLLIRQRARVHRRFTALVPQLGELYGLTATEVETFASWPRTLTVRRALPRWQRRHFDAVHGAIARIVALHAHAQPPSPRRQQAALQDLWDARRGRPRYD